MQLDIQFVDAFTDSVFKGNPAAVVVLDDWLSDELMQQIAMENNLSETAFVVRSDECIFQIRWFSPITEIDFCGHATLASAFVLFKQLPDIKHLVFSAHIVGEMIVNRMPDGVIQMDFPNTKPEQVLTTPAQLVDGLSIPPINVYQNNQAYFVLYPSQNDVMTVVYDSEILKMLKPYDVVVTALSDSGKYDFVSRYFWPANGGHEDPVTGSIHTGLAPLWAQYLSKNKLIAYQASQRGGILQCEVIGKRVLISGTARQYLEGKITV
jgi:PhzF family phenazine biosynthesis protein